MRVCAVLCAVMVGMGASVATAQEPLDPSAFGSLGMYPKRLSCADLPVFGVPQVTHRLTAAHAADAKLRRAFGPPDVLALPGGTAAGLAVGQQYFVRRLLPGLQHERPSAANPGIAHTAGWVTVIGADSASALARIDHACDHFLRGDYLEPFTAVPLPSAVAPEGTPKFADMGQLLFGNDGRRSFANGDLIVVRQSAARDMTAGARLSVFRDPKSGGPLVLVGHAIVLAVSGETATVVADRARDALYAGDWVGLDAAPTR